MKKIILTILALLIAVSAHAADQVITITIPSEKVAIAVQGFLKIYPNNETIDDPEWVDPEDGSEAPQIAKYTTAQWVREQIRRILVRDIRRGLQMQAIQDAQVALDDEIVL